MKKLVCFLLTFLCCLPLCLLCACGEVALDEIEIVAPETSVKVGDVFRLSLKTVPETEEEDLRISWEIDDKTRLTEKKGDFTANTCGKVKVKALVKGSEASDEIELTIAPPDGFKEYTGQGYHFVYPSDWKQSMQGSVKIWHSENASMNLNVVTEKLNPSYFTASPSSYQALIKSTLELAGNSVDFVEPVKISKKNFFGIDKLRVDYVYTLATGLNMVTLHQVQFIFNNQEQELTCVMTVSFTNKTDLSETEEELLAQIFEQFMPQ